MVEHLSSSRGRRSLLEKHPHIALHSLRADESLSHFYLITLKPEPSNPLYSFIKELPRPPVRLRSVRLRWAVSAAYLGCRSDGCGRRDVEPPLAEAHHGLVALVFGLGDVLIYLLPGGEREREREGQRDRQTESESETDRQTDRQTDKKINRQRGDFIQGII